MKNIIYTKGLVFGIGLLFIILSITSPVIGYKQSISDEKDNLKDNIEPTLPMKLSQDKGAALEIEIFGGLHTGVFIRNIGNTDALFVIWNISVDGGFIKKINVSYDGGVGTLPPYNGMIDLRIILPSDQMIGFGKVKIKVTADSLLTSQIQKEVDGFILLFYMIILV